jgi:hypothetical protein
MEQMRREDVRGVGGERCADGSGRDRSVSLEKEWGGWGTLCGWQWP